VKNNKKSRTVKKGDKSMPYLEEMLKQAKKLDLSKPGVFQMNIAHDDWCDLLTGKGDCNCNPDITIGRKNQNEKEKNISNLRYENP
jgi:hypothetical protein